MDGLDNKTSWQHTKDKKRRESAENRQSAGTGCQSCFGSLVVVAAVLYAWIQSASLIQRAAGDIGEYDILISPYTVLGAVMALAIGVLILWLPERAKQKRWRKETSQMATNAQGDWDLLIVEKRRKAASTGKVMRAGLLFLSVPVVFLPFIWFLPLSKTVAFVLGPIIGLAELLCAGIGLVILLVAAVKSAGQFLQFGKKDDFKQQFVHSELQKVFTDIV